MTTFVRMSLCFMAVIMMGSCDLFRPFDHDVADQQYDFAALQLDNYFLFRSQMPPDLYAFDSPKELYKSVNEPYTEYFNSSEATMLLNQLSTKSAGIGIRFDSTGAGLLVKDVFRDAPAEKAGLKVLDTIVRIDETDIRNMSLDEVYLLMVGKKGTTVVLRVKRRADFYNIQIVRDEYLAPSVFVDSLNPVTVNLQLRGFMNVTIDPDGTSSEFKSAMAASDWAKYVMIDLRGNGGGYIHQCLQVIGELVEKNTPVIDYTERMQDPETGKFIQNQSTIYADGEGDYAHVKLYVLVDRYTASASELMVSCLQGRNNVVVVGDTTYGKARGQVLLDGPEGVLAKITCMKFTPANDTVDGYDLVGIPPDIPTGTVDAYELALDRIETVEGLAKRTKRDRVVARCSDVLAKASLPFAIVENGELR